MSVREILEQRRSVRHYDPHYKMESETLAALIEGASKSPNGNNIQATRYLVIDEPNLKTCYSPLPFISNR